MRWMGHRRYRVIRLAEFGWGSVWVCTLESSGFDVRVVVHIAEVEIDFG